MNRCAVRHVQNRRPKITIIWFGVESGRRQAFLASQSLINLTEIRFGSKYKYLRRQKALQFKCKITNVIYLVLKMEIHRRCGCAPTLGSYIGMMVPRVQPTALRSTSPTSNPVSLTFEYPLWKIP